MKSAYGTLPTTTTSGTTTTSPIYPPREHPFTGADAVGYSATAAAVIIGALAVLRIRGRIRAER